MSALARAQASLMSDMTWIVVCFGFALLALASSLRLEHQFRIDDIANQEMRPYAVLALRGAQ